MKKRKIIGLHVEDNVILPEQIDKKKRKSRIIKGMTVGTEVVLPKQSLFDRENEFPQEDFEL